MVCMATTFCIVIWCPIWLAVNAVMLVLALIKLALMPLIAIHHLERPHIASPTMDIAWTAVYVTTYMVVVVGYFVFVPPIVDTFYWLVTGRDLITPSIPVIEVTVPTTPAHGTTGKRR